MPIEITDKTHKKNVCCERQIDTIKTFIFPKMNRHNLINRWMSSVWAVANSCYLLRMWPIYVTALESYLGISNVVNAPDLFKYYKTKPFRTTHSDRFWWMDVLRSLLIIRISKSFCSLGWCGRSRGFLVKPAQHQHQ